MHLLAVAKNENYNALKKLNCKKKNSQKKTQGQLRKRLKIRVVHLI